MVNPVCLGVLAAFIGLIPVEAARDRHADAVVARAKSDERGAQVVLGTLAARVWLPVTPPISPNLIVVLHGDLAGPGDAYQYDFARSARDALSDAIVVAVLRPGYADGSGGHSPGRRGLATGDNYTPEVLQALDEAINAAKAKYRPKAVTIVGHSGGAVLAADLAEIDPDVVDRLLLVSCPCDVPRWRAHMALQQINPVWLLPVRSRSPSADVRNLRRSLRLAMVVGAKDTVAPPELTSTFAANARAVGVRTTVTIVPGAGHNVFLDRRVLTELVSLQTSR